MIQTIQDVSDCVPLYLPHSLYLKPAAKFNVSVALPNAITGKTISNYEVMEKMRQMILPEKFSVLKVSKSTVGFIRFEGELEDRAKLRHVLGRLDGRPIRLAGFSESVKLRASEAKDEFPTRHDWDSFFRDARNMDEMKAGERPDTIHFANLPIKWFCPRHQENDDSAKPSESIFKRIFEKFGDVRCVDIPICDPYRAQMKLHMSGMQKFSFDQEMYFEGYIQFSEYVGFVKAMDEFRGMKLVRKEGEKNLAVSITVEFDKTKHLSDSTIKKRKIVRDRLIALDREKEEQEKKRIADEEAKKDRERKRQEELRKAEELKRMQREQRRKEKHLQKLRQKESDEISLKILEEERRLMETQRKLEGIRLLDALFERMKIKQNLIESRTQEKDAGRKPSKLINKKADKLKAAQEKEIEKMRQRVKQVKDGNLLKNFLGTSGRSSATRSRSPSINTISSDDSILNDPSDTKKKKKKKKAGSDFSSSDSDNPDEEDADEQPDTVGPPVPYPPVPHALPPGAYPGMYAALDWAAMSYPYAYDPFYAQRAGYYASAMAYSGYRGAPRGVGRYPRARGRGGYRGRGYDYYRDRDDNNHDYRDRDRSRSYSRSRSRSRSRRSRTRSRSKSRNRRSRSRSSSNRSNRRTRSRSRSRSRSRRSRTRSRSRRSRDRSRSYSRSRSRSRRSRSKKPVQMSKPTSRNLASTMRDSRTISRSRSRSRYRHRSKHRERSQRRRTHSKEPEDETVPESFRKHRIVLQTDKLVKSAKEIEEEVREHLRKQQEEEERREIEQEEKKRSEQSKEAAETNNDKRSNSHVKSRSQKRRSKSRSTSKDTSRSKSPAEGRSRKVSSRSKSPREQKRQRDKHRHDSSRSRSSEDDRRERSPSNDRKHRARRKSRSERSDRGRRSRSNAGSEVASPKRRTKNNSP